MIAPTAISPIPSAFLARFLFVVSSSMSFSMKSYAILAHSKRAANREKGQIRANRLDESRVILRPMRPRSPFVTLQPCLWARCKGCGGLPLALDPPEQSWRDWLLMFGLGAASLLEGFLRPDIGWRPVAVSVAIVAPLLIPWARAYPLPATIIVFGGYGILHLEMLITNVQKRTGQPFHLAGVDAYPGALGAGPSDSGRPRCCRRLLAGCLEHPVGQFHGGDLQERRHILAGS